MAAMFSIIVPTFSRSAYLARALDSILQQTFTDYSVIIVDDCSTDDTREVAARYAEDPRFNYHRNERQGGTNVSRNAGYDLATGRCITYLDDDDELDPDALSTAYSYLQRLGIDGRHWLAFDWVRRSDGVVDSVAPARSEGYWRYADILAGKIKGNYWFVFTREIIEEPRRRHDERLISDEGQLYLQCFKTDPPYYVPRTLYYQDDTSPSRQTVAINRGERSRQELVNLEIYLDVFGDDLKALAPAMLGRRLSRLGWVKARNRMAMGSLACHAKALRYGFTRYALAMLFKSAPAYYVARRGGRR
jgi:glycosyltransferase involved in cell wall biosynthesis